jgi:hypothetical protein
MGVGNCVPVFIKMGGLSSRTGDGMIKVKLMDTIPGFTMDGQFTYVKVYSKPVVGTNIAEMEKGEISFIVSPNPSSGIFYLRGKLDVKTDVEIYDLLGTKIHTGKSNEAIDLRDQPSGIYFVKIGDKVKRIVKE